MLALLAAAALLLAGPHARAQEESESGRERIERLDDAWLAAARAGDWPVAEKHLKALVSLEPANPNHPYNLACALAQQNRPDEANAALLLAVARGFADRAHVEADGHLSPLRETDQFRSLLAGWDQVVAAAADERREQMLAKLGPGYASHRDENLRLLYVSAFDPVVFERAREEITRLARWWNESLLPAGDGGVDRSREAWVTVWLPTRDDFNAWARSYAGAYWNRIGGVYQHDEKRLIAQGLGANLRHEFWHVMHFRDMSRRGQRHPIWVMEGLCSVVEDVQEGPSGEMVILPSWRTNMVRNLARAGRLTDWERLFRFERKDFLDSRKLANYGQSRAVFMYLAQRGALREWYAAYADTWDEDPSGLSAFTRTFGGSIEDIESDFRAWARALPEAAEEIEAGMATLPFEVEPVDGQGLTIVSAVMPRSARKAGLKARDVITDIDGEPVREYHDFVRVMSRTSPGAQVSLSVLRRGEHFQAEIELVRAR